MVLKYNGVEWDDSGNATIPTVRTNGVTLTDGAALKTTTTDTDTALIQAYDVDGAAYVTFGTLTAGNTPTFNLSSAVTYNSQAMNAISGTGGLKSVTILTSGTAQTYNRPAGVSSLVVECVGAGGGGGGVDAVLAQISAGGGGGGGGYLRKYIASAASSYTYTVGAGGAGGAAGNNNGSDGTATTFSDGASLNLSAGGGIAGNGSGGSATAAVLGAGGSGSNAVTGGDINISGGAGSSGYGILTLVVSGNGGSSHYASYSKGQIAVTSTSVTGNGGFLYGGGGTGAVALNDATDRAGGNGANGLIVIWEFS